MTDDQHGDQYGDDQYGDEYGDQYDDGRGRRYGDPHAAPHGGAHADGVPPGGSRWNPLPQGDYDDGATAFVKLPEGGVDALFASADSPLAAPGHGYVPPQITVAPGTDPAAGGDWAMPPADAGQWPAPDAGQEPGAPQRYAGYPQHPSAPHDPYGGAAPYDPNAGQGQGQADAGQDDQFVYRPGATGHWDFSGAAQASGAAPESEVAQGRGGGAPGQDVTGQWSIPVADGDLPDESGEFTASSLAEQWGAGAPATLPGGASAPWATQPAAQPWDGPEPADAPEGDGYADAPVEAGAVAPVADEAVADAGDPDDGAEEAAEGPVEGAADPAEDVDAESAPEAAGRPVTAAAEPEAADDAEAAADAAPDAVPEAAVPEAAVPEAAVPEAAVPEAAVSEAAVPEAAVPASEAEPRPPADDLTDPQSEAATATATAAPAEPVGPAGPGPQDEHPLASYVLRVNGADRPVTDAWIGESLLYVLRERLGLAGAKDGCSQGECGACNVQVDGRLVASCLVPAVTSAGSEVRTVEGLATDGQPSDVQRALARRGAVQCGFCVPGMAMTVHNLLEGNPAPTELEARQALCGNLCRCSGYRGVLEAVQEVVAEREALAADAHAADADEPRIPHQAAPGAGGVNASAFEPQPPPGTPDAPVPHDPPAPHDTPYGDHGNHGQDGGHA